MYEFKIDCHNRISENILEYNLNLEIHTSREEMLCRLECIKGERFREIKWTLL